MTDKNEYLLTLPIIIWIWLFVVVVESCVFILPFLYKAPSTELIGATISFFIFVGLYTCYSFGILQGSRKIAVLTLMTSALVPIQGVTQMPMLFTVIGPIGLAGGLVVIGLVLVGWKHFT